MDTHTGSHWRWTKLHGKIQEPEKELWEARLEEDWRRACGSSHRQSIGDGQNYTEGFRNQKKNFVVETTTRVWCPALQPDSETYPVAGSSHEMSPASHGLFVEVKEGTCPNAAWTITLFSEARPTARKRFPPDQQRLTFAGQQPELMKVNRCRRLNSAICHDSLESFTSTIRPEINSNDFGAFGIN